MSTAVFGAPEFRARSGRTVSARSDGSVMFDHANGYLSPASVMDAEEFFQAKRDFDLGRWRWPENPDYVVYSNDPVARLRVVRESDGFVALLDEATDDAGYSFQEAARAYFEAHPERKPWHAPDAGDHWVLHIAHGMALSGDEYLYKYTRWGSQGRWGFVPTDGGSVLDPTDPTITAGRRIWPEDAS